jgi:hypothetical protein
MEGVAFIAGWHFQIYENKKQTDIRDWSGLYLFEQNIL